jgi:phospholipase A1
MRILRLAGPFLMAILTTAEAQESEKNNTPGSVIAALLQDHEDPFLLYPYETNYLLYTYTSRIRRC